MGVVVLHADQFDAVEIDYTDTDTVPMGFGAFASRSTVLAGNAIALAARSPRAQGRAYTIVDGKECLMEEGDLVTTPGWTWHEHVHRGTRPIIWLDSLDVPLHRYLGTDAFEPGPPNKMPPTVATAAR